VRGLNGKTSNALLGVIERRFIPCPEEMEQALEDRAREPVEEWEEAEGEDGAGKAGLGPALEDTASAPSAGKKRPIKWARLAMTSDALSAGLR
jgi:hypothetical protein